MYRPLADGRHPPAGRQGFARKETNKNIKTYVNNTNKQANTT